MSNIPPPEKRFSCNIYFLLDDIQKTVKMIKPNYCTEKIEFIRGLIKSLPPHSLMNIFLQTIYPKIFEYIKQRNDEEIFNFIDNNFLERFKNSLPNFTSLVLTDEDINELYNLTKLLFKILSERGDDIKEFNKNYYFNEFDKLIKITNNYCKDNKNNIPFYWKEYLLTLN